MSIDFTESGQGRGKARRKVSTGLKLEVNVVPHVHGGIKGEVVRLLRSLDVWEPVV